MTESEAAKMIAGICDWDRAVVIYPADGKAAVRHIGMSQEQLCRFLYEAAHEVERTLPTRHGAPKGIQ